MLRFRDPRAACDAPGSTAVRSSRITMLHNYLIKIHIFRKADILLRISGHSAIVVDKEKHLGPRFR
jgi:hypothetical protein